MTVLSEKYKCKKFHFLTNTRTYVEWENWKDNAKILLKGEIEGKTGYQRVCCQGNHDLTLEKTNMATFFVARDIIPS